MSGPVSHVMSCHVMWCGVMSRRIMSFDVMQCGGLSRYVMLTCDVIGSGVMACGLM